VDFWRPYATAILRRHGMDARVEIVAGQGGTFPTLLTPEAVIKLFGHLPSWRASHEADRAATRLVATDPAIRAPALLAEGRLFGEPAAPWPYLVATRMQGMHWGDASLSAGERAVVAAELGRQVRRIHALAPSYEIPTAETWAGRTLTDAARETVLPAHLVAQIDDFVAKANPDDRVFVHGDLMFRHVFIEAGRLAGMIDWGDALVVDRHYELAQLQLNLFDGDKTLLQTFLDHSDWPVEPTFARRSLVAAFHRQAVGLAQHPTMDVFYKLPHLLPLDQIETLDELADAVFGM